MLSEVLVSDTSNLCLRFSDLFFMRLKGTVEKKDESEILMNEQEETLFNGLQTMLTICQFRFMDVTCCQSTSEEDYQIAVMKNKEVKKNIVEQIVETNNIKYVSSICLDTYLNQNINGMQVCYYDVQLIRVKEDHVLEEDLKDHGGLKDINDDCQSFCTLCIAIVD